MHNGATNFRAGPPQKRFWPLCTCVSVFKNLGFLRHFFYSAHARTNTLKTRTAANI